MFKNNKILFSVFCFFICFLFCMPLTVISHSGRTDSSGGHYDDVGGGYHYHHGLPAHQHKNGKCTYTIETLSDDYFENGDYKYSAQKSNSAMGKTLDKDIIAAIVCLFLFTPVGWGIFNIIYKLAVIIHIKCVECNKYNKSIRALKRKKRMFIDEYHYLYGLYEKAPIKALSNASKNGWITKEAFENAVKRKKHIQKYIDIISSACVIVDDTIHDLRKRKLRYDDEVISLILSKDKFFIEYSIDKHNTEVSNETR